VTLLPTVLPTFLPTLREAKHDNPVILRRKRTIVVTNSEEYRKYESTLIFVRRDMALNDLEFLLGRIK
jgi:hypothetical protein